MSSNEAKRQQLLDAFHFRHATKSFDPKRKIADEDFQTILEAGRLSPSSVGLEPWKFLVVQNSDLREKIKKVSWGAQGQLPTASHFVVLLARRNGRYDTEYFWNQMTKIKGIPEDTVRQMMGRYAEFQGEDFNLFESERALFDWACKQTYIALGNMMTAAALLGIDSCPIEGFNQAALNEVLEQEGLLENGIYGVSVMAAFGYRVQERRPQSRRSAEDVIQWLN
ncbi:NAD(P)H-dependent oxidoreductase [Paenibacillus yonginensis]|uniref:NAD(P)H-dependent oxidoreductase n=1 Tax=Paenibacillus yonginensis TaxID=1462996 RepID=A0A1B1MZ16_9BACL|nr:NAD(P)H-dependent oxidoreductase [Paenibacillus yonginensis]ANS74422.1 NAD(P)H-dependent oxidoreductase [Paenibacillus yonginensis]